MKPGPNITVDRWPARLRRPRGLVNKIVIFSLQSAAGIGMGHVPISWAGFIKSEPQFITLTKISGEELEGYNYYRSQHTG